MTIELLRDRLRTLDPTTLDPPPKGRVGATLVLLAEAPDGALEVTYTRRQPFLSSHPGQISFPGGRVDPGETIAEAALREASEEIGLDPSTVTVLGQLPAFYIPPSRFWMSAVVARWDRPHPLHANPDEVAEVLTVSTATLTEPDRWRAVPLSAAGATWAWELGPQRLLWGATAVVTGVLLQVLDPQWSGGTTPEDLPVDRHIRPWENPQAAGITPTTARPRARLRDIPTEDVDLADQSERPPDDDQLADDVIHALRRLERRPPGPVVVLAGEGHAGTVARMVVGELVGEGADVALVDLDDPPPEEDLDTIIHDAGVLVDGLLDRTWEGTMPTAVHAVIGHLRGTGAPLIAIDLPSGIHPQRGMVAETVSADVTVAPSPLLPGHVGSGAAPFLGDLYLSRPGRPLVRAHPVGRPTAWAE